MEYFSRVIFFGHFVIIMSYVEYINIFANKLIKNGYEL